MLELDFNIIQGHGDIASEDGIEARGESRPLRRFPRDEDERPACPKGALERSLAHSRAFKRGQSISAKYLNDEIIAICSSSKKDIGDCLEHFVDLWREKGNKFSPVNLVTFVFQLGEACARFEARHASPYKKGFKYYSLRLESLVQNLMEKSQQILPECSAFELAQLCIGLSHTGIRNEEFTSALCTFSERMLPHASARDISMTAEGLTLLEAPCSSYLEAIKNKGGYERFKGHFPAAISVYQALARYNIRGTGFLNSQFPLRSSTLNSWIDNDSLSNILWCAAIIGNEAERHGAYQLFCREFPGRTFNQGELRRICHALEGMKLPLPLDLCDEARCIYEQRRQRAPKCNSFERKVRQTVQELGLNFRPQRFLASYWIDGEINVCGVPIFIECDGSRAHKVPGTNRMNGRTCLKYRLMRQARTQDGIPYKIVIVPSGKWFELSSHDKKKRLVRKAILKCLSPSQREEARLLYPSLVGPKPQPEKAHAIEGSAFLLLRYNLRQLLKRIASYYRSLVKRVTSPGIRRIEKLANAVGTVNLMPD